MNKAPVFENTLNASMGNHRRPDFFYLYAHCMWKDGESGTEIGRLIGVGQSGVSRHLREFHYPASAPPHRPKKHNYGDRSNAASGIYFISDGEYTKIGKASHIGTRFSAISGMNPRRLKLVHIGGRNTKKFERAVWSAAEAHGYSKVGTKEWFEGDITEQIAEQIIEAALNA